MYPNRHVSKTPILHFFIFFILTSTVVAFFPLQWLEHPWFERMMYLHQSTHTQPTHISKPKQQQISTTSNTMTQHTHTNTPTLALHYAANFYLFVIVTFLQIFWQFGYYLETHTIPTNKQIKINNSHFINSSTESKPHFLVTYNNHIYMHNKLIPLTT